VAREEGPRAPGGYTPCVAKRSSSRSRGGRRASGRAAGPPGRSTPPARSSRPFLLAGAVLLVGVLLVVGYALAASGNPSTTPGPSDGAGVSQPPSASSGSSGADATTPTPSASPPGTGAESASASLTSATPAAALPGIQTGLPPWPPETADLRARLDAIGLPALSAEGTVLHIHQHLDIVIDGQPVTVPADIGIDVAEQFLAPVHTHDTTGIIHVESPTMRDFTLGEFFDIWGVRFDQHCIGGECDGNGRTLSVFVDGQAVTGDPRAITLEAHQEILVALGTPSQLPQPIPSSYQFPAGY
jgi:hypothetical protein